MSTPAERLAAYEPVENGRVHVPDPAVMAVAQEILRLFIDHRGKHTPGKVTISKFAIPQFYKAGKICLAKGITPEEYLRQILMGMEFTGSFWAASIASEKCLAAAERGNASNGDLGRYRAALATWAALSKTLGPEIAIRDPQSPFSPLLRMLLATEYGLKDVAAEHLPAALFEYRSSDTAKELFGELMKLYAINP